MPHESDVERREFQEHQLALFLLQGLLDRASSNDEIHTLKDFGLPNPEIAFNDYALTANRLIREEIALAGDEAVAEVVVEKYALAHIFFLDGPGGTGKTFVQNTVMARLRSGEQRIVFAVASSGIAATLLDGGHTAHSRFKIPLDSDTSSLCNIKKGSRRADLLKEASLIFWDEVHAAEMGCGGCGQDAARYLRSGCSLWR